MAAAVTLEMLEGPWAIASAVVAGAAIGMSFAYHRAKIAKVILCPRPVTVGQYTVSFTRLEEGSKLLALRVDVRRDKATLSWQSALEALASGDEKLAEALTTAMQSLPKDEMVIQFLPTSRKRWTAQPMEFVALECPALASALPDFEAFESRLDGLRGSPEATILDVPGAAVVAPSWAADDLSVYVHASSFFCRAPDEQMASWWQKFGEAAKARIMKNKDGSDAAIWVSSPCPKDEKERIWFHALISPAPPQGCYELCSKLPPTGQLDS